MNTQGETSTLIADPLTIRDAMKHIQKAEYLLPAIQRKFVWSTDQICLLFDSILRNYPISTFMSWYVTDKGIKKDYKFYRFLQDYCERFSEENPLQPTFSNTDDFYAIIDGQQRLTSLYIGLNGSYAEKRPRVWWPTAKNENDLPSKQLYLNLQHDSSKDIDESEMRYEFKFLTQNEVLNSIGYSKHWFKVGDVQNFESVQDIEIYLLDSDLADSTNARNTLNRLYEEINDEHQLYFNVVNSNDLDLVLDIFIRTNSGGTKLSFADLLVSIAIANWDGDFRKEIDEFCLGLLQNEKTKNYVDRDWVLKACLMLIDEDVKFKVKNFSQNSVNTIQTHWNEIKSCIEATFEMLNKEGFNETTRALTTKNAVMPIAYYLFKQSKKNEKLYKHINSTILGDMKEERDRIIKWLRMSLLRGVFGGQGDTVLTKIRDVIRDDIKKSTDNQTVNVNKAFPLKKIVNAFKGTNKEMHLDDDYIESLLTTKKDDARCRNLLHLIFPEVRGMETFQIDHMHPKNGFKKDAPLIKGNINYNKQELWDSLPNLLLLPQSNNASKNDKPLKDYLSSDAMKNDLWYKPQQLLADDFDFSMDNFPIFFEERKNKIRDLLVAFKFVE